MGLSRESQRTGILLLALVAGVSLAGGLLGWKLQQPPVAAARGIVVAVTAAADTVPVTCDPVGLPSTNVAAIDVRDFACYREISGDDSEISRTGVRAQSSRVCWPLPSI